jgi:hypothetical protein
MDENSKNKFTNLIAKHQLKYMFDNTVSNNSKTILNKKIVSRIITLENLKISTLKMLIPFIFYIYELKFFLKRNQLHAAIDCLHFNKFKILFPFIFSIDIIHLLIHLNKNFYKNKIFVLKEFGKMILKASISLIAGIGLSSLIKSAYGINNVLSTIAVEFFSIFTSNFLIETLCDKFIGIESKHEIYFDKIQNSDQAYEQSLHCFRVDKNIDEITLKNIKSELWKIFNPDKFINEDLKEKARKKMKKYQAAYDTILNRINNKKIN